MDALETLPRAPRARRFLRVSTVLLAATAVALLLVQRPLVGVDPAPWPDDLERPRAVATRAASLPPWSWPSDAAFAAAQNDARRRKQPVLLVGRTAPSSDYPALSPLRVLAMAFTGHWEPSHGPVRVDVVALDGEGASMETDDHGRLLHAYGFVQVDDPSLVAGVEVRMGAPPLPQMRVVDLRPMPSRPASEEVARLTGYASALLADSPGDARLEYAASCVVLEPPLNLEQLVQEANAAGALGRLLRLRVRIMRPHGPRALFADWRTTSAESPIHGAAFFAGLCFKPDLSAVQYEPWEEANVLGRAIAAAGLSSRLAPWLRARVEDDALDPFDRFRMLEILAATLGFAHGEDQENRDGWSTPRAAVARRLLRLRLPEPFRWRVREIGDL
ncbi:MAG TPA: hypothetical protein VEI02_16085 [Planctomycetota bacterium]|nr:hypothetical protein [Planctomycetota bacterium]